MKKRIISIIGMIAFFAVMLFNVNLVMSVDIKQNLKLSQIEAMAQGEDDDDWKPVIKATRTLLCTVTGTYIIRCDMGYGNCDPSWQDLCGGPIVGWP